MLYRVMSRNQSRFFSIQQQFQINSELLRNGKRLSELTQVQVPTPPPPGPNIQQVMMLAKQISMSSSLSKCVFIQLKATTIKDYFDEVF